VQPEEAPWTKMPLQWIKLTPISANKFYIDGDFGFQLIVKYGKVLLSHSRYSNIQHEGVKIS